MKRRIAIILWVWCFVLAGAPSALAAGLPTSASKVEVSAAFAASADGAAPQSFRVQLAIADGWHVNAHPASLDFLIATDIHGTAGATALPLNVTWPAGRDSGIEFNGTAIEVYSTDTVIPVHISAQAAKAVRAAGQLVLDVRVQACSDAGICLPPSTLTARLAAQ